MRFGRFCVLKSSPPMSLAMVMRSGRPLSYRRMPLRFQPPRRAFFAPVQLSDLPCAMSQVKPTRNTCGVSSSLSP